MNRPAKKKLKYNRRVGVVEKLLDLAYNKGVQKGYDFNEEVIGDLPEIISNSQLHLHASQDANHDAVNDLNDLVESIAKHLRGEECE